MKSNLKRVHSSLVSLLIAVGLQVSTATHAQAQDWSPNRSMIDTTTRLITECKALVNKVAVLATQRTCKKIETISEREEIKLATATLTAQLNNVKGFAVPTNIRFDLMSYASMNTILDLVDQSMSLTPAQFQSAKDCQDVASLLKSMNTELDQLQADLHER